MTDQQTPADTHSDAELLEALADLLDRRLISHAKLGAEVSGEGFVVGYQLELESPDGVSEHQVVYIETRPRAKQRDGVLIMREEDSGDEVAIWLYPRDPALPALQTQVYPDAARVILTRLGVSVGEAEVSLSLEAYRPGKRAVVRVDSAHAVVFLKVVAPRLVAELSRRHSDWASAGLPVPRVLGWSNEGLLALSALGGTPASVAIGRIDTDHFDIHAFADALEHLQERIAAVPGTTLARASLSSRLDWYERRLAHTAPTEAARIHAIARRIEQVLAAASVPAGVTIHGDLHIGQIFLDDTTDAIAGVLDIDTAGIGDPADDAAAMYAHLIVTAQMHPENSAMALRSEALAKRWQTGWNHRPDADYAARASAIGATHLLAHALNESLSTPMLLTGAEQLLANIRRS